MDRGLLYTLRELMLRPGHLIRGYVEGRRARHVKPLVLVLTMAAILTIAAALLNDGSVVGSSMSADFHAGASNAADEAGTDSARFAAAVQVLGDWFNRHLALVTLLLLPFEAWAFKLAYRRFRHISYPEWLTITAFLTAQAFVVWLVALLLQHAVPRLDQLMAPVIVLYNGFSLVQYFEGYPRWKSALRAAWGFAMYYLLSGLLMGVALVAIGVAMRQ
ncbi:DUF3667 domain-containing protein [Luteimonas sp. BDR2-5]|uniref:DUF3667 domain-containing protein n=1 Tax=Proluteimonas luteida TaxID=2878685 RepID=UPI001E3D7758|nr:DUF3667 domain-containing protein [Luteimonas sp. BDR2-5]MCD9027412.1 DUF3667 domain-containing protein [Luteimonas sp. BDR2-5]